MKYDNLTHEERELVLFIENTEPVYDKILGDQHDITKSNVKWAGDLYKVTYAHLADHLFTDENRVNVVNYLKNREN